MTIYRHVAPESSLIGYMFTSFRVRVGRLYCHPRFISRPDIFFTLWPCKSSLLCGQFLCVVVRYFFVFKRQSCELSLCELGPGRMPLKLSAETYVFCHTVGSFFGQIVVLRLRQVVFWVASLDSACRVSGVFRLSLPVDLSFGCQDDTVLVIINYMIILISIYFNWN
jgi:hypothetical protein